MWIFWLPLRLMLMLTVIMFFYMVAVGVFVVPYLWAVVLAMVLIALRKRTNHYSAYGTARWAEPEDLEGMIDE